MKESVVAKFATTAVYGKVFWRKVLDIYATSIDYDSQTEMSKLIFATVQNKMHWRMHHVPKRPLSEIIIE